MFDVPSIIPAMVVPSQSFITPFRRSALAARVARHIGGEVHVGVVPRRAGTESRDLKWLSAQSRRKGNRP